MKKDKLDFAVSLLLEAARTEIDAAIQDQFVELLREDIAQNDAHGSQVYSKLKAAGLDGLAIALCAQSLMAQCLAEGDMRVTLDGKLPSRPEWNLWDDDLTTAFAHPEPVWVEDGAEKFLDTVSLTFRAVQKSASTE